MIPNLITSANLVLGAVGIVFTLSSQEPIAFYFVIAAGLMDFLDGFAARMLKVQSEIGKQLDSLADLISFGLLPAFYILQQMKEISEIYWLALLIIVFSALRLAIFNIDDSQKDHFRGLPTPANAIMLTSIAFLPFQLHEYTFIAVCLFSSMLLVSPVRLLALKFTDFGWKGNEARWILIIGVLILAIVFQQDAIPYLIPFYIILSFLAFFFTRQK